ncbi:Putative peptidoglycan binding domain-containing protein [Actinacidiphila yanglinensis]|uniref:Putative peptidoglycan binding domain-containing protein n=1 Tax=Actinacidiphila yanglinensis TaxID=310779 RepID=A0A1H5SIH5_9ACTN|nr:peptidoglycan-binding domain-containing protein [Actinacidiphila yanglinensis]SEF50240.1 Putative peptidoglycan binding domain-containing protein [Actinacidiphila yanglinensis]
MIERGSTAEGITPGNPPVPESAPGGGPDASPDAGAEDVGGIRAAERAAERAAAVAAVEGFHPLRLRPYVAEPGDEVGASTVRRLIDTTEPDTAPGEEGPATTDLGLFPATYAAMEYATTPRDGGPDADHGDAQDAAHGRHRRRRRGLVVAAAAVAASALAAGAVAVSGQIGEEQHGTDRALPDRSTSMPDVVLPSDAAQATASTAAPMTQRATPPAADPSASPSTTPATSAPGSSTPSAPSTSASPPASAATSPLTSSSPSGTVTTTPGDGTSTTPQVLELGDSGPAVADLQRRLTEVWAYKGPIDGVFDQRVKKAVATFQVWYWVSDSPDGSHDGVYGPNTRSVLERQTQGDS